MLTAKLKEFLFLLYICIFTLVGYGCTTIQNPIQSVEPSADVDEIALLQVKIDQLDNEINMLNQRKLELEAIQQRSASQNQALKIQVEQLEKRIEYLNNQKFDANVEKYQAEIARLNKQEQELTEQIAVLNSSLSDIYTDAVPGQESRKTPKVMTYEIKTSVNKLKHQLDEVKQERNQLKQDIDQSRSQIAALKAAAASVETGESIGKNTSPLSLDVSNNNSPEIVEVFYGTNRARQITTWSDIFKPLLLPVVLLIMFFIIAWVIKLILKDHLQRPSILTFRFVVGAAFLYFIFNGIQLSAIKWQSKNALSVQYGPDRISKKDGLPFELGVCKVSIPPTHEPGVVELPSLMYLELTVNPDKHFVMSDIQPQAEELFFANLNAKVEQSADKDMFVFVHGFHNTFENAAFRTAQIAYDLNFSGAPAFFSWPSQGNVVDYPTDESNAGAAVQDLRVFLTELITRTKAKKIHLIAHSMGNRVLTRAVKEMSLSLSDGPLFNEVVLAAPDMDAKTFKDVIPEVAKKVERVTLYASSRDKALVVSNVLHGEYQRAGESKPAPVIVNPIESIDVSSVTDGHSYIADDGHILDDLNNILKNSRPLTKSVADPISINDADVYWILREPVQ